MPDCACSHSHGDTFVFRDNWGVGGVDYLEKTKSDMLSMVAVTSHDPLLHE